MTYRITDADACSEYQEFYRLIDRAYERLLREREAIIAWAQFKKDHEDD
jgi:hypothetical protein